MVSVILLNGPAGVGKTTVGRILAALVPNGACIHGDCLKGFVVSRVDGAVAGGLGYVNGATIAANFVAAGYDLVVFEYVFEHPSYVQRFRAAYHAPAPLYLFTLWAPLPVVMERERERHGRERLGERVTACYQVIDSHLSDLGCHVETSHRSAQEVAAEILRLCGQGHGLLASAPL